MEARAAAKKEACKPCEAEVRTAPAPEVRVSTGRKIFPGPGMPLWSFRGSPELS